MTLGPILVLLAIGRARFWGRFGTVLETYGRVPLLFYILHLYVIHLAAALLGLLTHQPVGWLLHGGFFLNYPPDGQPYHGGPHTANDTQSGSSSHIGIRRVNAFETIGFNSE